MLPFVNKTNLSVLFRNKRCFTYVPNNIYTNILDLLTISYISPKIRYHSVVALK